MDPRRGHSTAEGFRNLRREMGDGVGFLLPTQTTEGTAKPVTDVTDVTDVADVTDVTDQ